MFSNLRDIGIYFHWPFCLAKCPYCDFNVHLRDNIDHESWRAAYLQSLKHYASLMPEARVASVFFGGGTPSLMEPDTVESILKTVGYLWPVDENCEITIEANPTSVEIDKFKAFHAAGVNRVSLGIQALNDSDLKFLGRKHNVQEGLKALENAKNIFDRVSFDLIYVRPNQSLKDWELELKRAAVLADGHLSLYQLTIERSTPFYFAREQGKFSVPGEDAAADFYNLTQDILEGAGLPAYEVSNHARAGQESRHNLIYWHYGDYIGIGPGAHGRLTLEGRKYATRDHSAPDIWLNKVTAEGSGAHPFEELSSAAQFTEALMMGLRLREGMDVDDFEFLDREKLSRIIDEGWMIQNSRKLILTREGMLRLNAIVPYILSS